MDLFSIRKVQKEDREWICRWLVFQWGAEIVISHDVIFHPADLPGFIAFEPSASDPLGLITFNLEGDDCEIITLDSLREGIGVGSALIDAVIQHARYIKCKRVFLVTTNDNLYSLRFYQKRGFRLSKINVGATDRAREQKPEIPTVGEFGIPIHDEIELEYKLE
jgi:GNAT superfamily N-acetyltransferase